MLTLYLNSSAKQSLLLGFIFGMGFFGVGVSWVFVSVHEFGNTSLILALFITLLFLSLLSLFMGIQGYLFTSIFPHNTAAKFYLAFPALWILIEWVRSWLFTGFPWLLIGVSQVNGPFRGFVPIIGQWGVGFLVVFTSTLITTLFLNLLKKNPFRVFLISTSKVFILIIFLFALGLSLKKISWTQIEKKPLLISLLQGNVPQTLKWDKNYLQTTLDRYLILTESHWNSRIIVWPEAAIPMLLSQLQPFIKSLGDEAARHHATIILGIPTQKGFNYYNSMIAVGVDNASYSKRHLVIFGEYFPQWITGLRGIVNFLNIPMSNFSKGGPGRVNFKVAGIQLAPFICYEIAYDELLRQALPRAQLLITINDDAWFGHSFALAQHLQIGQFQALAAGRYLVFLSNTGLTAIVNPQGQIVAEIPPFKKQVLTANVWAANGRTPWVILGNFPLLLLLGIFLIVAWTKSRIPNRES